MTCQWCGDRHGADQLCQRAQRGMTRRSFCFLFGAGMAGLALAPKMIASDPVAGRMTVNSDGSINVYRKVPGADAFHLIATVPATAAHPFTDDIPAFGESTPTTFSFTGYFDAPGSKALSLSAPIKIGGR